MSGRKECYVTMTSTEADRLRNSVWCAQVSEDQARQREQRVQNALNAANREREALNRALNNEINGLHADIRQISVEQNRRFLNQEAAIEDIRRQSEKNRQEMQNQINGISARIEAKENNHKKLAEFWISQTQAYIKDIEQYRHEMFTPGDLNKLKGKLNQMLSDMKNEAYQSAISTARSLFNEAVDLKENVLNAETEWLYYHGLFTRTLAGTETKLNECKELRFTFDMEHGTETVDAKVNYWTCGSLDEVSESISDVKQKTGQIQSVSTKQLIEHIDSLNKQNVKMDAASEEAKNAMILSQNRAEMANKLADALEEAAWKCEDIVYEGGEHDQPVHIKFSDGMGNEIVAIITPEINTQNMSNKLELHFFDQKNDEKERQKWIASIENGLKQDGLEVGNVQCVKGYEVKASDKMEIKDIKATAKKKIERTRTVKKEKPEEK
ncbi:MAG: hypothetical protein FWB77_01070 [Treponema sp.]|nr:hypothetical protein [Treponema sp.]